MPISFINMIYLIIDKFTKKDYKKNLNSIFLKISFSWIFLINFFIIGLINILFIPLFYIKHCLILMNIKMILGIKWSATGLWVILKNIYYDMLVAKNYLLLDQKISFDSESSIEKQT